MSSKKEVYFVPHQSHWPLVGAIALFLVAVGAGLTVQHMETDSAGGAVSYTHLTLPTSV